MKKLTIWIKQTSLTLLVLIIIFIISLTIGSVDIQLQDILTFNLTEEEKAILDIRLSRILVGLAVGGTLSIAGVILQGMFRNPLVEPYTLGISGGAGIGICINIIFGISKYLGVISLPLSGFIGALFVMFIVYLIGIKRGPFKMTELLLTGVMVSFICSSLIMLLMSITKARDLHGIIFWIMGSLEEPNPTLVKIIFLTFIFGLIVSYLFCMDLNAFLLGEEEALHLGVDTERSKRSLFILASLLTSFAVSIAGIIGFVGLVVPHITRRIFGTDHRILLITSGIGGGTFLIFCDTIARTIIAPIELPVGVITGLIGGTLFIYFLSKR